MGERLPRTVSSGEIRFRNLVEKAADGVLVLWPDGVVAYANPAAGELLGRDCADLVGGPFGTPVAPGETAEIDLLAPGDGQASGVAEMRVVEVEWEGRPALLATLRDVTQRKQAAAALAFLSEASDRLARSLDRETTLASVAGLAVQHLADWCVIDLVEGEVTDDAASLRRLAAAPGDPQREAKARRLSGRYPLPAGDTAGVGRALRRACADVYTSLSGPELLALALLPELAADFRELGCHSALVAPMVARGRVVGAITYVSASGWRTYDDDEQALARHLAERAALAIDNAGLYDAAQEALRKRDEFLAVLAHELRNPLAPILAAAELMKQLGLEAAALDRQRATVERQGQHLARLLDDLLDLSRITHGKIDLRVKPLDLAAVVRDALQVARGLVEGRRHSLTLDVEHHPPLVVEGDATRLAQVVGNLLTNAARYTEPGGRIELRAFRDGGDAVVSVRDTGRGIPPEMLGRVFEPFTQVNPSLDRGEGGLGIGLTLVRRLAELHGGRVTAASDGPGLGSVFEVRLPASDARPAPAERPPVATTPRRVLLVEDNADGREMLGDLLRLWGHTVVTAAEGVAGLAHFGEAPPDVALIDIGLPGMSGYRLAEEVRRRPGGNRVLLIAVTGYGLPEDRARAFAAGFDDHLVKPVDLQRLAAVLQKWDRAGPG